MTDDAVLVWPAEHHCHEDNYQFHTYADREEGAWLRGYRVGSYVRQPMGVDENSDAALKNPYRTCGYCGSIHPEDLYHYFQLPGVTAHMADMKYGWPHKVYVDGIPNPHVGIETVFSYTVGPYGAGPRDFKTSAEQATIDYVKFYTVHLKDLDRVSFAALEREIRARTGIAFEASDGEAYWGPAMPFIPNAREEKR